MSVMMSEYEASNPGAAAQTMRSLRQDKHFCPMCGRVAKWYYRFYEGTSKRDKPFRCTLHEISPIPGPSYESDDYKVSQLY